MMVMMILFTAIKILSFYGKQNRNALQHKKKCIDKQICIIRSQKQVCNFDTNNYEHQCCSDEDPANLQQDMYII